MTSTTAALSVALSSPVALAAPAMHALNPLTAAGRAALDGMISLQATIIAYTDDFKFLMIVALAVTPLVLLLKRPATPAAVDHSVVAD